MTAHHPTPSIAPRIAETIAQSTDHPVQQAASEAKMNQIRELLVGEYVQQFEARIRQLEIKLEQGLDAMKARIDALAAATDADNRTSFDELARNIEDLARSIRQIPRD